MAIDVVCSACGKRYRLADALAGKRAKCACGSRIEIPEASAPKEIGAPLSFFEQELTREESRSGAASRGPRDLLSEAVEAEQHAKGERAKAQVRDAAEKLNPYRMPGQKVFESLLRPGASRILQFLAATVVGAVLVAGQAAKAEGQSPFPPWMGAVIGSVVGAGAGSVLLGYDWVKSRKAAGRGVPLPLNLFLGMGVLSIVMWFIVAIGARYFMFGFFWRRSRVWRSVVTPRVTIGI